MSQFGLKIQEVDTSHFKSLRIAAVRETDTSYIILYTI